MQVDLAARQLQRLDDLVDFRNAIVHGSDRLMRQIEQEGTAKADLRSYLRFRRALEGLAREMDVMVPQTLAGRLGIDAPW